MCPAKSVEFNFVDQHLGTDIILSLYVSHKQTSEKCSAFKEKKKIIRGMKSSSILIFNAF
jgi:hypothetical protein